MSADLLEAAIEFSLRQRLRQHQRIKASVECDAWGLVEGSCRRLRIHGKRWRTPLELTAELFEVDIGALYLDYSQLLWQQRVALRAGHTPVGSTRITLTATDLGNFMVHPIFIGAAQHAVQGHAFSFDPTSVSIQQRAARGEVWCEGVWAGDGKRYRVLMCPGGTLQVGAQQLAAPPASSASSGGGSGSNGSSGISGSSRAASGSQLVASGLANFFGNLSLDLQGVELQRPAMKLCPGAADAGGDLLEITMRIRIRSFPPLDLQF